MGIAEEYLVAFAGQRGLVEETGAVEEPGDLIGLGQLWVEFEERAGVGLLDESGFG